ncbi:sel1 repeat family protein [Pseudomonas dryadis]|uniref:Sel1 repeat family protein n=2 Tax=Pseudomonadales TaxID=72274 RepID=A0A4Q9R7A0_9GAMM|nr:sel1 repeat family protein [Pseudomonas dryadis]TBV00909.1 sel1 repeat family protein [Pseudomonas dryadis]TBV13603.1 sel1 repeat family protein [Pseudomonas sp. FRB 230]
MPATPLLALACGLLLIAGCVNHETQQRTPAPEAPTATTPEQQPADGDFERLRSQAQRGDLDSQFQLGSFYFVGKPRKDLKQAEYWWKMAADKGHAEAAVSLAYLYTGRDNPEFGNPPAMLKYLNQSASSGNPMAQHILGNLYLRGIEGVDRDPDQARRLFQSACRQNYAASCKALDSKPGA